MLFSLYKIQILKEEHKSVIQTEKRKRFRISRRLSIVLFCFCIATIFWLLLALSRDYPTKVTFPIQYTNLPGKKVIVNDLPDSISLDIQATGFRILAYSFTKKRKTLEVDVASRLLSGRMIQSEVMAMPTKVFAADFNKQFGPDVKILGYQPDSIVFYFSDLIVKRLPVKLDMHLGFDKQFDYSGDIQISPDSVDVAGPPSIVNSLTQIETELISMDDVKTSLDLEVNLKPEKVLSFSVSKINLKVPIEKFTEGSVDVRIQPLNVQAGFSLKTFPDKVQVRYLVSLSKFNEIKDHMFDVVVNAEGLENDRPEKLALELVRYPTFLRRLTVDPEKVDYILRKQ